MLAEVARRSSNRCTCEWAEPPCSALERARSAVDFSPRATPPVMADKPAGAIQFSDPATPKPAAATARAPEARPKPTAPRECS